MANKPKLQVLDQDISTDIRNTIEFLGIWAQLNNPDFKVIEFDDFKKQERVLIENGIAQLARLDTRE